MGNFRKKVIPITPVAPRLPWARWRTNTCRLQTRIKPGVTRAEQLAV